MILTKDCTRTNSFIEILVFLMPFYTPLIFWLLFNDKQIPKELKKDYKDFEIVFSAFSQTVPNPGNTIPECPMTPPDHQEWVFYCIYSNLITAVLQFTASFGKQTSARKSASVRIPGFNLVRQVLPLLI